MFCITFCVNEYSGLVLPLFTRNILSRDNETFALLLLPTLICNQNSEMHFYNMETDISSTCCWPMVMTKTLNSTVMPKWEM